jgi:hypothetical protein
MRNISGKVVDKIKHILLSITLFENHAVCEIRWKSAVETQRA